MLETLDALVKPIEHFRICVACQFQADKLSEHANVSARIHDGFELTAEESDRGINV